MSPEQATGDLNVGPPTDIWALGCVLYEMLTGEPPFTGSTPQAVLGKIITGEVPSARAERASVPRNVEAAILRALEKIPADRFSEASEMAEALQGRSHISAVVGPGRRSAVGSWLPWTIAVVLAVLLGQDMLSLEEPDGPVTRLSFPVPGGFEFQTTMPSLAVSPDGRTVVYRSEGRLLRRSLDRGSSAFIPESEEAQLPTFREDGSAIAFVKDGRLYQVGVDGTQVTRISDVSITTDPRGLWWAEDGTILYAPSPGALGIYRLDPGGAPQAITELDSSVGEVGHLWPQLIDGGRRVLFTVIGPSGGWADASLAVRDLRTGERRTVLRHGTHGRYLESGHLIYATGTGSLAVVGFDPAAARIDGDPAIIETDVRVAQWGGGASYAVSDEGTLVYVPGSTFSHRLMIWFERGGRPLRQVGPAFAGGAPRISPDGDLIAVVVRSPENTDIWIWNDSTGERSRQTFDLGEDESPVWSPDGRRIAYRTATAQGSSIRIKALGDDPETVLDSPLHLHLTSWSSDGRWLALDAQREESGSDVFLLELERPDSLHPLLATPTNEAQANFSPDGKYLAYQADMDGRPEIYLRELPDFGRLRQVSFDGGTNPRWSPDGRELYFTRVDTLFASSIAPSGEASNTRPLFSVNGSGGSYDVSPTAEEFIMMVVNPDAPARTVNVTLNFLAGADLR